MNRTEIILTLIAALCFLLHGADGQGIDPTDTNNICTNDCPNVSNPPVAYPDNPVPIHITWTTLPASNPPYSYVEWSELQTTTNWPITSNSDWQAVCCFPVNVTNPATNEAWIPATAPMQFFRVATKATP